MVFAVSAYPKNPFPDPGGLKCVYHPKMNLTFPEG